MKIYRTKGNKYGWRTKFVYRESMGDIIIIHEHNHKGYWCESKAHGHNTWCHLKDIKEFMEIIKQLERG